MTNIVKTSKAVAAKSKPSLVDLSETIQSSLNASATARQGWIDSMVAAAVATATARQQLKTDQAFGQWWDSHEFSLAGKLMSHQDRAALVAIGASEAAAKYLFENTERRSIRMMVQSGELESARIALGLIAETSKRHSGPNSITPPKAPRRVTATATEAPRTMAEAMAPAVEPQPQPQPEPQAEPQPQPQPEPQAEAKPIPEDIWATLRDALRPRQQEILKVIEDAGEDGISKDDLLATGHTWATTKHLDTNIAPLFMRGLIFAVRPGHLVAAVCLPMSAATPIPSPLNEEEYKLLRACLHPDGGASKDRLTKAFNLLDERRSLLVN